MQCSHLPVTLCPGLHCGRAGFIFRRQAELEKALRVRTFRLRVIQRQGGDRQRRFRCQATDAIAIQRSYHPLHAIGAGLGIELIEVGIGRAVIEADAGLLHAAALGLVLGGQEAIAQGLCGGGQRPFERQQQGNVLGTTGMQFE